MNNEGFDDFLKKLREYDAVSLMAFDNLSMIGKLEVAFTEGCRYQAERDAEALRKLNVVALRKQA